MIGEGVLDEVVLLTGGLPHFLGCGQVDRGDDRADDDVEPGGLPHEGEQAGGDDEDVRQRVVARCQPGTSGE